MATTLLTATVIFFGLLAANYTPEKSSVTSADNPLTSCFRSGSAEKAILEEQNLRFDRYRRPHIAYSPRHTDISSLRLMEGADIYQIAKNWRGV